ncbi:hypothetical protein TcWFU_002532 [Taenia crassiceps]|uniref:Uncharacterized protein n=1 Tax=Taenia crassiceps TaxID=6207 RepID=A0ABR4Q633_9CEST
MDDDDDNDCHFDLTDGTTGASSRPNGFSVSMCEHKAELIILAMHQQAVTSLWLSHIQHSHRTRILTLAAIQALVPDLRYPHMSRRQAPSHTTLSQSSRLSVSQTTHNYKIPTCTTPPVIRDSKKPPLKHAEVILPTMPPPPKQRLQSYKA